MCNTSCLIFGAKNLTRNEIEGKKVIEIGSYIEDASLRPIIELLNPAQYIGIDIKEGPGVDIVCDARDIIERFGKECFDIVVSTELIEHVKEWRKVISNIKNICKPNGVILITTRSYGFDFHGFPFDFWRYELRDMEYIFSDCIIEKLEKERISPGVFIKVRKPQNFSEKVLSNYELFSIILNKRVVNVDEKSIKVFKKRYLRIQFVKDMVKRVQSPIFKILEFLISKN